MTLTALNSLFQKGKIKEQEYTQKMHKRHGNLFEYSSLLNIQILQRLR